MPSEIPIPRANLWARLHWTVGPQPALQVPFQRDPDALHVFHASLDLPGEAFEHVAAHLSADEAFRASRYKFDIDRRQFVASRGLVREVLGAFLGVQPRDLVISGEAFSKPRLMSPEMLEFNVSHSADQWLLAVSTDRILGVDIEQFQVEFDESVLAKNILSPLERVCHARLSDEEGRTYLKRRWVMKEACLKATGIGLSVTMDSFTVPLSPIVGVTIVPTLPGSSTSPWQLIDLPVGAGTWASLAVSGASPVQLRLWALRPTEVAPGERSA